MACLRCRAQREVPQTPCAACGSFAAWERVAVEEPTPAAQAPTGPTAPVAPAPPSAAVDGSWTCQRCDRANDRSRHDCIECGSARPSACGSHRVSGDAGGHVLGPGGQLLLGRRTGFSPAASHLVRFPNVGRQHALVSITVDGQATVTDLASANGTWLAAATGLERLPAGVPVPVGPGSTIQLGNSPAGPNARVLISEVERS